WRKQSRGRFGWNRTSVRRLPPPLQAVPGRNASLRALQALRPGTANYGPVGEGACRCLPVPRRGACTPTGVTPNPTPPPRMPVSPLPNLRRSLSGLLRLALSLGVLALVLLAPSQPLATARGPG